MFFPQKICDEKNFFKKIQLFVRKFNFSHEKLSFLHRKFFQGNFEGAKIKGGVLQKLPFIFADCVKDEVVFFSLRGNCMNDSNFSCGL